MRSLGRPRRRLFLRAREEEGQAAMEMLLIFPLFILIVLLSIDFGVWMYQSVNVANSVREAARYGAVNCGSGSCTAGLVEQRAVDRSNGFLDSADITVGWVDRDAAAGLRGSSVVVKVNHSHGLLFFPISVPIYACADMRLERDDSGTIAGALEC